MPARRSRLIPPAAAAVVSPTSPWQGVPWCAASKGTVRRFVDRDYHPWCAPLLTTVLALAPKLMAGMLQPSRYTNRQKSSLKSWIHSELILSSACYFSGFIISPEREHFERYSQLKAFIIISITNNFLSYESNLFDIFWQFFLHQGFWQCVKVGEKKLHQKGWREEGLERRKQKMDLLFLTFYVSFVASLRPLK